MSQFVGFLEPPKKALEGYDSTQLHHAQADGIPEVFTDAMSVREEVYVEEQKVPLENEFDHDDPRSYHWVAYASVGTSSPEPTAVSDGNGAATGSSSNSSAKQQDEQRRKSSTANKLAVGTIRLVPPPHPPHPEPGSSHKIDNAEGLPSDTNTELSNKTSAQNPREPYIKLGRLAVLKPFRGLGLANLLVNAALTWASQNGDAILPPLSPTVAEHRALERGVDADANDRWQGLVLVHAQVDVEKVWARYGFVRDHSLGEWDEEGIPHMAMWRRVELIPGRKGSMV